MMVNKEEKYGVGQKFMSNNYGEIEIIEKLTNSLRKVLFLDYGEYGIFGISNIKKGVMKLPSKKEELYNVGKSFKNSKGYEYKIIEKLNNNKRLIRFTDYDCEKIVSLEEIKRGSVKNSCIPSVLNIGYGANKLNRVNKIIYQTWVDMIKRVHDEKSSIKNPSYRNTTICQEWYDYQNFAQWYEDNYPYHINDVKFQLDKDLLQQDVENKIYSPQTCIFLPSKINGFLANNKTTNSTGYLGVTENKQKKGYFKSQICDYDTKKKIMLSSNCKTKEEAHELYKEYRAKNAEKVKEYLRSLDYLPEEIIELVR